VASDGPDFPFCSERCRLIDLGKWASGAYVIPSSPSGSEEEIVRAQGDLAEESDESK